MPGHAKRSTGRTYAEPDDLRALLPHGSPIILRAGSVFGVPFRLQQDLSNEANVAGCGNAGGHAVTAPRRDAAKPRRAP
jgi:hypothetical protein